MSRPSGRAPDAMRDIRLEPHAAKYAEGSCMARFGETWVLCTASLEDKPPPWLRGQGKGWVTAEYAMLPRATHTRGRRDGRGGSGLPGRTQEIQRLIGRALRAVTDLERLGERQITIDCDVIQADGGTRTAAITGGWVALKFACKQLVSRGVIALDPLRDHVAAISCGVIDAAAVLDLDYTEDSRAETDANFAIAGDGRLIEVQASAEGAPFARGELDQMTDLALKGAGELFALQKGAIAG